jgi:proteasome accessory factor A
VRDRVYGLETEYGVTFNQQGERRLTTDELARQMFRNVVTWGRSSNVFLENGARLYLDVGAHPEYATPECATPLEAVVHEKAGDRIVAELARTTAEQLAHDGVDGTLRVFRNNTDFAGNSYGSHENYLVERTGDFQRLADALIPFLVTRQIFAGAGKVLATARGPRYVLAQRAEHIWESVSSATTRSRPVINSRDEPHADADRFRRLHVIVGDSNMSEFTTWLRIATCDLVVRMAEERPTDLPDIAVADATRAIRDVSTDLQGRGEVALEDGRRLTALDVQSAYLEAVERFLAAHHPDDDAASEVTREWRSVLETIEQDAMRLHRRLDWVAKLTLIEAYRARHGVGLSDARVAMLDISYHDLSEATGLYHLLVRQDRMDRLVTDETIEQARTTPPARTRAALRGRFVAAARASGRDFTVDWVHLKINEYAQQAVLCQDPLVWEDARVDRLIASL